MTARPRDPVIAGLGMTEIGRVYGRTAAQFAAEAVRLAAADAGLALGDIDGLLVSPGSTGGVHLGLQRDLDLHDLKLLTRMQAYGSTAAAMVQFASMAIQAGLDGHPLETVRGRQHAHRRAGHRPAGRGTLVVEPDRRRRPGGHNRRHQADDQFRAGRPGLRGGTGLPAGLRRS